jgi:hypothetical protein
VRYVSRCLNLNHGKDGRVVMATHRSVLDTKQSGETGGGNGEALTVPELEWQLLEGETDDIAVRESEGVVTAVVGADSDEGLCPVGLLDAEGACTHGGLLVAASEEDCEAVPS